MSEYDLIAPFYDIEHAQFDEDVNLYLDFAALCMGPVLELACGSGRLLVPLAQEGYEVTGVDTSAVMLSRARQRLQQQGLEARCTLVQQDMRFLRLEREFCMVFIALGSFAHVTTRNEQQQVLAGVRAHLVKSGTFILDIANADARYMEHMSGQVLHQGTWQQEDGTMLTHFVSPAASTKRHFLELTHFYDLYRQGGTWATQGSPLPGLTCPPDRIPQGPIHHSTPPLAPTFRTPAPTEHVEAGWVQRTVVKTQLYLFERNEVELLLEQAGFGVKDVYGDYDLGQCELDSPRMIFRAEAR